MGIFFTFPSLNFPPADPQIESRRGRIGPLEKCRGALLAQYGKPSRSDRIESRGYPVPMLNLADYDFELPKELIAQQPVASRSDARLMIVDRAAGTIEHAHVRDLADWLSPADCLVLNDSRVVPARLDGIRSQTGGRWQGLFLAADEQGNWQLLCKTRGRLQEGERIVLKDRHSRPAVQLMMLKRFEEGIWIARPDSSESTWGILDRIGRVPLPPYIRKGEMVDDDLQWYQTVYADQPGSVAAPTAGLHLTQKLLSGLEERGIGLAKVTLHVGIGTFRPIAVQNLDEHRMHSEWGRLTAETAEQLSQAHERQGRVVAVGTTSVRVLETAAGKGPGPWEGETDLFIKPGYQFQAIDALLTNFHLPKSTLLVLVRTFGGEELIKKAYWTAVEEGYRFFSYGDAMLIL